ncbi:MaoC/PaaZ C-terminal domain-containing protein [Pseudoteredinibacter isoporae]|uniref:Acyl dehydratase n=1 Tax=Pseudoteredinibacter isoporae TaxID=570281 RepID=A0A7X0JU88_9GAMM|nr:MaoC/PaaZ C-terminal domain-containing protein [Pseudoteredinibacter isoporae]MBB6521436.1 acyl dehydratase [Pseudoteredinibacter isoporae]NHO86990.1 acyl dehydratase [Pseudoteredinibacter isoporae]NIB24557.1 acyl dehydratase [Pseudoteredinibacter isoporae]
MQYWQDIPIGQHYRAGPITLHKKDILEFAAEFDPQPFHLSSEAADESIFGGLCASGWQVCALMMRLLADTLNQENIMALGSPGVEQLRWLKPVFANDQLHADITIEDKTKHQDYGDLICNISVYNQEEKCVMSLSSPIMVAYQNEGDSRND